MTILLLQHLCENEGYIIECIKMCLISSCAG